MKQTLISVIIFAFSLSLYAKMDAVQMERIKEAKERFASLPAEEQKKIRAERMMKRFGGMVTKPNSGSGSIAYVNCTKTVSSDFLQEVVSEIAELLSIKICVKDVDAKPTLDGMSKAVLKSGSEAAIFIVEDVAYPTLLVAPESEWAIINVTALSKDKPDKEKLKKRIAKQAWRAFGLLCGAADSQTVGCAMKPVSTLEELDGIGQYICPEPLPAIVSHLKQLGVKPIITSTYRQAVREGWAPAPTNEYQKAIWDKVHAMPTAPIKIKPETKKVRE